MQVLTETELRDKTKVIRQYIIEMLGESGSGHPGGSLSSVEILVVLYFHEMKVDPANPTWEKRDRFVLSKGHAAPVLYAVLAEKGFFPVSELKTLRKFGSILQGHPDMKKTPGVEMSTGSLGQGLSVANGMAIAGKIDNADYRVYAIIGDGESQEGQIWEAAMTAVHYKLDNLTVFLDYNQLQIDGRISDVKYATNPVEKWKAFGWNVLEIDGHNISEILDALDKAKQTKGKPTMIVAHTIKGKGVSFMEDEVGWHGKAPNKDETEAALRELRGDMCG